MTRTGVPVVRKQVVVSVPAGQAFAAFTERFGGRIVPSPERPSACGGTEGPTRGPHPARTVTGNSRNGCTGYDRAQSR